MADGKGSFFSKTVQKHAGRAKERILQNLGKADKTRDELFDEYLNNFNKQQTNAAKLNKEVKHYMNCIKEMQSANKSLFETLVSVYDPDWLGHEQLYVRSQHIDMVWNDYSHKLNDQIIIPLQTYLNQFPDVKDKIGKRGRKLVDYDRQRHNYEALLNNPKKRDDLKVSKCKEQLDDAKKMYEILNNELHDDLPALYDSRIPFMVSSLETMFTAENVFHNEVSKVYAQLVDLMEKLAVENQKGTYMLKKPDSPTHNKRTDRTYEEIDMKKDKSEPSADISQNGRAIPSSTNEDEKDNKTTAEDEPQLNNELPTAAAASETPNNEEVKTEDEPETDAKESLATENNDQEKQSKRVEELYDIPVGATTTDLPPGILYRVKATYKYVCEDQDELTFEPGEIIQVIEYEEPEEQEDGWLMGVHEQTGQKGLFPANFTRPI